MVMVDPVTVTVSAPPMVQSTAMKVAADSNAEVTPAMKSTGESVAILKSSAMRYSGFWWSPLTTVGKYDKKALRARLSSPSRS